MSGPRMEQLILQFIAFCQGLGRQAPALRRGLYVRLADAAASLLANLGEAWDETSPGDKRKFFRYALRSAGECQRLLRGLATIQAISPTRAAEGDHLLFQIKCDSAA